MNMSNTQKIQKINDIRMLGPKGITLSSQCDEEINVHVANYLWILDPQYAHVSVTNGCLHYLSTVFYAATDKDCKWRLRFYPNGISENKSCMLYLGLDSQDEYQTVFGEFKISIFGERGEIPKACCKSGTVVKFDSQSSFGWGFCNFVENESELFKQRQKAMIACVIKYSATMANLPANNITELRLSEDLQQLLKNEESTDIVLSVKDKEFRAHKVILAARSPVFANMFKHENMKENQENKVDITDIEERVAEEMLNYIYTGKPRDLETLADKLLVVAEKYSLDGLKNICGKALSENLSVENAIDMLILANLNRACKLKSNVLSFIVMRSKEVMKTTAWKNMGQSSHSHLALELCEAFSCYINE